ncbi:MAG: nicotinate-nucleotide diphosphorylase (carboxylating), partial [Coriobacteriales bacterium]|nr:nicotinate-nucleotide diphosphorylase (carboxylating) [Coriobacteriales bacterium]
MRVLDKLAVRIGGGGNHRMGLSDAVMLKDNHIEAAGGVMAAVQAARQRVSFMCKIEVECETLQMVKDAIQARADVIMLDNMTHDDMKLAIQLIDHRAMVEISGNVSEKNVRALADLDVDIISSGALTHSCGILDFSMKHLEMLD